MRLVQSLTASYIRVDAGETNLAKAFFLLITPPQDRMKSCPFVVQR
jgi:hypothetical protein